MMIIKESETIYKVFDVLGEIGVWDLDFESLECYLKALESRKAASSSTIKTFPLLENSHDLNGHSPMEELATAQSPDSESFWELGLPDSCFFDTSIVLEYAKNITNGIITPPSVSLDVNTICNYACRWCCSDVHKDPKALTLDLRCIEEKIIKPLVSRGNLTWYLVGGEPALSPTRTAAIAELIVKHTTSCSSHSPLIALDSNGTAFEENVSLFKKSGINTIQFSLSSTDPEKDGYLRGCPPGVNPVKTVVGAVKAAKSNGLHCGINMVLWKDRCKHNLDDIEKLIDLSVTLEVDFVRITPAVCGGVAAKNGMNLSMSDLRQTAQRINKLNTGGGNFEGTKIVSALFSNQDTNEEESGRPMICRGGSCFIHVDHKGDVFPCAMVMPDYCAGNVTRDNLEKLWFDTNVFASWRKVVELSPECATCRDRNFCVGKCPAYAWFKFGDMSLATKPEACAR